MTKFFAIPAPSLWIVLVGTDAKGAVVPLFSMEGTFVHDILAEVRASGRNEVHILYHVLFVGVGPIAKIGPDDLREAASTASDWLHLHPEVQRCGVFLYNSSQRACRVENAILCLAEGWVRKKRQFGKKVGEFKLFDVVLSIPK